MYLGFFNPDISQPATPNAGAQSGFWSNLPNLINAGLTIASANNLLKINRQRLANGLAPLSPDEYGVAPSASVSVGVSRDTKNLLIYGGLGLGALLLFMNKRK